ncbi:unnamed protein product [Effrenium voratum]|nr:unnamed protein product [Effrenium voratum]
MSAVMSLGSLGHPELCRKPCLFLRFGSCDKGSACHFCHRDHESGRKLSRRQREDLRSLDEAQRLALTLPHLRAKQLPAEQLLSLLEKHLASLPLAKCGIPEKRLKALSRSLGTWKFGQLLNLCREPRIMQQAEELQAEVAAADPALLHWQIAL